VSIELKKGVRQFMGWCRCEKEKEVDLPKAVSKKGKEDANIVREGEVFTNRGDARRPGFEFY